MKKSLIGAIMALTLVLGLAQAEAQQPSAPNKDPMQMLKELMNTAQAIGVEQDTDPSPTPGNAAPPIDVPTAEELEEDVDMEWPAGLRRADPSKDPLGAKLDAILVGGRRLRKEVKGLGSKVETAITRVETMEQRQIQTFTKVDKLETRVDTVATKVVTANSEVVVSNGKLAVAEQRVDQQEKVIVGLKGEVGNLSNGLNNANASLAHVNARLDRKRLTNLFGLLGTD